MRACFRALANALVLLVACSSVAHAPRAVLVRKNLVASSTGTGPPDGDRAGPGDPYSLYAFDRARIPWHKGSGGWGKQCVIAAPTPPTTTTTSNASTASAFKKAAAVNGRRITVTGDWTEAVSVTANDVHIVVPRGRHINRIFCGSWPHETAYHRIKISGSVDGRTRGGTIGRVWSEALAGSSTPECTDLIVDGVDNDGGDSEVPDGPAFQLSETTRVFIHDVRALTEGELWLGTAHDVVIAKSNFYAGAATRAEAGFSEGWAVRNAGGPFTIIDSQLLSTRYHQIRVNTSDGSCEVLAVLDSTLVASSEGKTSWNGNDLAMCPGCLWDGVYYDHDEVYAHLAKGCSGGAEMAVDDALYSRIDNTNFHDSASAQWSQSVLDAFTAAGGGGSTGHAARHTNAGNTFSVWAGAYPSWGGPGDPREISHSYSLVTGEGSCTGYAP